MTKPNCSKTAKIEPYPFHLRGDPDEVDHGDWQYEPREPPTGDCASGYERYPTEFKGKDRERLLEVLHKLAFRG